ncbi:class IV adenylate cyclase [Pyrobaculum neutrophilum]|uniref:Adenylyl cyclase CyaB n=1 Tax=Pyrobaculum neutrophilum (strain DSM 2338 / JCM 9278 / NBRC 100436 / V24Sta) TaxID=444157 RepID=B1YA51_PYRNV|nr:class IV adenylate cyclase [Pyrobaculum neutrophilum]ACB39025.1 adenylyl cyclase CyaB [Pyrobaculum neutrophilum V24Sta]
MLEVEVKYRAHLAAVKSRLPSLGFSPSGAQSEEDVYFQHPCRNFAETDEALRVRVVGGRVEVTYKGPRLGLGGKTRAEITAEADLGVLEVLERLGFKPVARIRKRREYYTGRGLTVSLDWVEGLGEFVEIEKVVEGEGEVAAAVAEIRRLAAELGVGEEVGETYLELFLKAYKGGG